MPFTGQVELQLKCKNCGAFTYVTVDKLAWNQYWLTGRNASQHFGHLTENELHWLVSGICWNCSGEAKG